MIRRLAVGVALGLLVPTAAFAQSPTPDFTVQDATVAGIHVALAAGDVTCEEVVQDSLDRIAAYDDELDAILTVNADGALDKARDFDDAYEPGEPMPAPLACAPLILKDNFDTGDLPTTGGAVTLAESVPPDDAFTVARLRDAGAILVAKANLQELALGGVTTSSLGGQTRNPYDLTRTPGGSSGGTGAAIAAGFAVLGTGSDTGQSIRSPSSANSLVGVRPSSGLVSRDGVIPSSSTQDEVGPITRTVEDAARMLDVMAGYDPADPITAVGAASIPDSYTDTLSPTALEGARIGVVLDVFGTEEVHEEVNRVTNTAIDQMTALGAEMIEVRIPDFEELTTDISVANFETKALLNAYFESLGPDAPVSSLEEFIAAGEYDPAIEDSLLAIAAIENGTDDPEYKDRLLQRDEFRRAIAEVMAEHELDALLYPHQQRLVAPIGEPQLERNGVLSNATGYPAVTFPGGFSSPTDDAPLGVPVGIELLGRDYTEAKLLAYAYAFEQATEVRQPPLSTPPLDEG